MVEGGYAGGGIVDLNNQGNLVPPGLSPPHLVFNGVRFIALSRLSNGGDMNATVSDPAAVAKVLALLSASAPKRGVARPVPGGTEYQMWVTYGAGPQVSIYLAKNRRGRTIVWVLMGAFGRWYYLPPAGLRADLDSVLGVK